MAKGTRSRWTLAAFALMAAAALVNAGCLLAAAGVAAGGAAAGYFYYQGKVCMAYDASFDDTRAAVRTALSELGMPVVKEEDEKGEVFIESRTDGDRVRIYMDPIRSQFPAEGPLTRVCIRVATFGDHPVSYRIFDQIGAHLVAVPIPGNPNAPTTPTLSAPPAAVQPPAVPPETPPPPLAK